MSQIATKPALEYSIKILNGPDKGVSFRILSAIVRIGRGPDNDIVLAKDNKSSRNHAEIFTSPQGPAVKNISRKNSMLVNNKEIKECLLQNGTTIQLGSTKLKFEAIGSKSLSSDINNSSSAINSKPSRTRKKGNIGFYLIIAVVGFALLFLLTDDDKKKKKNIELLDESKIQQQIETNQELIKAYNSELKKQGRSSQAQRQAQSSYLKGFRDYEHGLYHRAIESFQACLSLNPKHSLCIRYRNLATRKFNELIQYKMILGRQYKEQHQFSECKKTFENVMYLVRDTTNKTYIEAKSNYNVCRTLLRGRY